ncbi:MAG: ABC transporter permease [Deltaproteobacteria bacterium]|nr:ABC transporter permease [Deltaproteobacteria bacterium]
MLKLAWRNIWRNSRRTILTVLAIAFATSILQFFVSIQLKSYDAATKSAIALTLGQLQVQKKGYLEKPQIRATIEDPLSLESKIKSLDRVEHTSIRSIGFALISSEKRSYGLQVIGIMPEKEKLVSSVSGLIKKGEYLDSTSTNDCVIGEILAKNLKVDIGDEVTILGQGKDGSLAASVATIRGIFDSGTKDFDRVTMFIPYKTFQDVFSMQNSAHSIVVMGMRLKDLEQIQSKIEELLKNETNLVSLRWDQLMPGLKQSIELDMSAGWIFYLTLVLIVTFSIVNTFLMSVLERSREFGIMLAIGARTPRIMGMVVIESILLTLVGIFLGVLIGSGVITYFSIHGFTVPGAEEIAKLWNLPIRIYPELTIRVILTAPLMILTTTFIGVMYPVLKILWLKPLEAMRAT